MTQDDDFAVGASDAPTDRTPFDRLLRPVEIIGMILVSIAMLIVLVFMLGQVMDRHFLKGVVFNAYEQIAQIGLVWLTFVGMAMGFRTRHNIVVDLIDHLLPGRAIVVKALVLDVLSLVVMCFLVTYGLRLVSLGSYQRVMGTPFDYGLVYTGLVTGSVMLVLFLVARIISGAIRVFSSGNSPS